MSVNENDQMTRELLSFLSFFSGNSWPLSSQIWLYQFINYYELFSLHGNSITINIVLIILMSLSLYFATVPTDKKINLFLKIKLALLYTQMEPLPEYLGVVNNFYDKKKKIKKRIRKIQQK